LRAALNATIRESSDGVEVRVCGSDPRDPLLIIWHLCNATGQSATFTDFTANYGSQGALAGGEVGYDWQSGNYIVGVAP
jgi:hypothetical protein